MAQLVKIDSNVTGLRYALEDSIGVLPTTPDWIPLEPNTYGEWGGQNTLEARRPINDSRQLEKGVIVDFDASGGIVQDFTQTNFQDLLQGFFFADFRRKGEEAVTAVDESGSGTEDTYTVADTTGFQVGNLIEGQNFTNSANNAVNEVTGIIASTAVQVADGVLVDEASPPATAQIVAVGFKGAADDVSVDTTGDFVDYVSAGALDFTTLDLNVGDWVYVGGDAALSSFTNTENNGQKRVRAITATRLTIDKSVSTMVNETTSGGERIEFYLGRFLKNELPPLIKRRTYNLERTLGFPDDSLPSQVQAEYLVGAVPGEFVFNIAQAAKLTADLNFVALDVDLIDAATPLKTGNRPSIVPSDAFNTTSDFKQIKMHVVSPNQENPDALFAFITDLTITINNNLTVNKAVSVRGGFEVTAGAFEASGTLTAYFADIAAVQSVNNNDDVTIHAFVVKQNAGWIIDLPLLALGDGRPNVELDQAITLPLTMSAARGRKIDSNLDHTAALVFFDYLPNAADPN